MQNAERLNKFLGNNLFLSKEKNNFPKETILTTQTISKIKMIETFNIAITRVKVGRLSKDFVMNVKSQPTRKEELIQGMESIVIDVVEEITTSMSAGIIVSALDATKKVIQMGNVRKETKVFVKE